MAVVSISRIQVRRGTALQGTGLPQLASGEFGWAIDTQELYIGNGSTAEGAPAVGNTQILTTNTNVLELVGQYTYRDGSNLQTSESVPVSRSIAERLDDRVSIRSFGGSTQTQQLQKAFYELFLRGNNIDSTGTPVNQIDAPILHIEPGTFTIDQTIYVPPFTTIIGAGKDKTVLKKTGDFDMFRTVSSETFYEGLLGNSSEVFEPTTDDVTSQANQARRIRFEDMTLEAGESTTTVAADYRSYLLRLDNCRDSEFKNIRFVYSLTDLILANDLVSDREVAIGFNSKNDAVCSRNNKFIECDFYGVREAAYGPSTVKDNEFVRCTFSFLRRGVALGEDLPVGQTAGAQNNLIIDGEFDNITEEAFLAPVGQGNKSQNNKYGNNVSDGNGTTLYPIVSYGENGNYSVDDTFERTYNLAVVTRNVKYYPEVAGELIYTNNTTLRVGVSYGTSFAFRLPADTTKFYTVEYHFRNTRDTYKRTGTLTLTVDLENSTVALVDDYEYVGVDGSSGGAITFTSALQLNPSDSNDVWGVNISTVGANVGQGNEDLVTGDLAFKITSKS